MYITVPLTLVIEVPDEETRKYYLNDDDTITLTAAADLFDTLEMSGTDKIISVNNLTQDQLRQALATAEPTL